MSWLAINRKIVRAMNSCDRNEFSALIDEVNEIPKIFKSKLYVWNWIRGRDFYKMMAYYINQIYEKASILDNGEIRDQYFGYVDRLVHDVLEGTRDEKLRKSFVWGVTKQTPVFTLNTLPYMSPDKVRSILKSKKVAITDTTTGTILEEYREVLGENQKLSDELGVMASIV